MLFRRIFASYAVIFQKTCAKKDMNEVQWLKKRIRVAGASESVQVVYI